jgi:hypothetical protein
MATTTYKDIRDSLSSRISNITPTLLAGDLFRQLPKGYLHETWVATGSSELLRKFAWRRGLVQDPPYQESSVVQRNETVRLTVSYPDLPGLYGNSDRLEIERVMRSDARQIRDLITSPGGYLSGQHGALVRILGPIKGPARLQPFHVTLIYDEAVTYA